MSFNTRNYIVIGILVVAAVFSVKIQQAKGKIADDIDFNKIPLKIGQWQGVDVEVTEDVYQILETKDILSRQYRDGEGTLIDLAIVYAGNNRQSFHPPEVCFQGGGLEMSEKGQDVVTLAQGELLTNRFVMSSDTATVKVWYWFLAGNEFVTGFHQQQRQLLLNALQKKGLAGALIRIALTGGESEGEVKAKEFIKEITPFLRGLN